MICHAKCFKSYITSAFIILLLLNNALKSCDKITQRQCFSFFDFLIKLPSFWCPTCLTDIDGSAKEWELPKQKLGEFEFHNSCGLRYEAEEMRKCINEGLLECEVVTQKESLLIARIQDEIRRQIGATFSEDE